MSFEIGDSSEENEEENEKIDNWINDFISHLESYGLNHYEYYGKWYECDKDMTELSRQFPNIVFRLEGIGEEFPDIWHGVWKNGKKRIVKAEIVYPKIEIEDLE
jgi:hypothetical protein